MPSTQAFDITSEENPSFMGKMSTVPPPSACSSQITKQCSSFPDLFPRGLQLK